MSMKIVKSGMLLGLSAVMIGLSACSSSGGSPEAAGSASPEGGIMEAATAEGGAASPGGAQEPAPTFSNEKATIVFSTFFKDDMFAEAKAKYEAKHPNITIDLQYVETDDAHLDANMEKYKTTMNAAMLSGKGPDILSLDMLPSEKYIGRHLLADLSGYIKNDPGFKNGDYFNNILEKSQSGDGMFGIPLGFFLDGLIGDADAIGKTGVKVDDVNWTWESFSDTISQMAQSSLGKIGYASSPDYLLGKMVKENSAKFVDEKNKKSFFDSAAFTDMMQKVKTMNDKGVIGAGRGSLFMASNINSPWDYLVTLKERGGQSALYAMPRAEGEKPGGYFFTYRNVAVNEKSTVKGQAWDFIRFMLSEEMEIPPERAGFPINKKVYEKQVQQLLKAGTVKAYAEGPLHGQSFPVNEEELKRLEGYLSQAVHSVNFQKTKIEQIVTEESAAFFNGQKPAQDVARLIQNKVMTYLNE